MGEWKGMEMGKGGEREGGGMAHSGVFGVDSAGLALWGWELIA